LMTVGPEAALMTFVKADRVLGERNRRIVRFALGHIAPIVSTSIVFSIVAPSDGIGAFVAPLIGTIITCG